MERGSSSGPASALAPGSAPAARGTLELVVVAGQVVTVVPLPARGAVTLGRGEECDVRIDHRSVSRRHALLHVEPALQPEPRPALRIEDLGSANGTFVRDARSAADSTVTQPLRKLSRESIEIGVGERVNLGAVPIMIRRTLDAGAEALAEPVVRDPKMRALYEQVARTAHSPISVLMLGEAGVGKQVLARAVHERSPRAGRPFIEVSCTALAAPLLEAELFGHEQSAFAGPGQARPGLLEAAEGGTVFLHEIGALPLPVQVKLLRVLEDRKVVRVGGREPRQLDARFVSSTDRDLEAEVARGAFRQDLYFRLNGVSFVIPPLRERASEIGPLAEQFLVAAALANERPLPHRLSMEALRCLESYVWPGNVRELRQVIDRAAVVAEGELILPADLPSRITGVATGPVRRLSSASPLLTPSMGVALPDADAERRRILETLEACAGNQTRAARLLGMSLRTLSTRLAEYNAARARKRS